MPKPEIISLPVSLGSRSYTIRIGRELDTEVEDQIREYRAQNRPIVLITDSELSQKQAPFIRMHFPEVPTYVLPAGESSKNLDQFSQALEYFAGEGLDRSTVIFAFGGGVVGDFAGYVAASYMRGLDFVQIPTTLLAMVDSSVGGKTGVNLAAGKNLVGAFHQPQAVLIDLARLDTLDDRQFSSGMAEVIKAGLLADRSFFERLEQLPRLHPTHLELSGIVRQACAIKAEVVAADEKESASSGGRALLNLGHTFGHAIEQCTQYREYLHGEAISIGICMAADLSGRLGYLESGEVDRIRRTFSKYDLPICLTRSLSAEALMTAMGRDKKKKQGKLKYVVMESIGRAITRADIETDLIHHSLLEGGAC